METRLVRPLRPWKWEFTARRPSPPAPKHAVMWDSCYDELYVDTISTINKINLMLSKITVMSLLLFLLGSNPCVAQAYSAKEGPKWGKSVEGVQLSISMTNDVVGQGRSFTMVTLITNASTNTVFFAHINATVDFQILLTNASGKLYNLTPHVAGGSAGRLMLDPGLNSQVAVPVTVGKNVEPGDYELKATRVFRVNGSKELFLESNLLRVKIEPVP